MKLAPALCLDLDGTVRRSISGATFIKGAHDIELLPGIKNIVSRYRSAGYIILGISNQAGVAHGFKTFYQNDQEVISTQLLMNEMFHIIKCALHDENGTVEPYNHRSLFRKPQIGMLALCEFECFEHGIVLDWNNSLFVGDRPEDEQCANNASIKFEHIDLFINRPHSFEIV